MYGHSVPLAAKASHCIAMGTNAQGPRPELIPSHPWLQLPDDVSDEAGLLLGDILSTAFFCAERGGVGSGDTVAVLGCGPVGLLTVMAAKHMGAETVGCCLSGGAGPQRRTGTAAEAVGILRIPCSSPSPCRSPRHITNCPPPSLPPPATSCPPSLPSLGPVLLTRYPYSCQSVPEPTCYAPPLHYGRPVQPFAALSASHRCLPLTRFRSA